MMTAQPDDQPNANEGADPSDDIAAQNPGGTTRPDLGQSSEGKKAGGVDDKTKVQDLAKGGRENFDPNEESPA